MDRLGSGTDPIIEAGDPTLNIEVGGYLVLDIIGHGLTGASAIAGYGSAGLDGMAAMGVQTNFRNFRTSELYRNNGALSGNRTVSGRRFFNSTKAASRIAGRVAFVSSAYDIVLAFHTGNYGYAVRGLLSGGANFVPVVGFGVSYGISRRPADYYRLPPSGKINPNHERYRNSVIR